MYEAILFEVAEEGGEFDPGRLVLGLAPDDPTRCRLRFPIAGGYASDIWLSDTSLRVWWDGALDPSGWARALRVASENGHRAGWPEAPSQSDVLKMGELLESYGFVKKVARYTKGSTGLDLVVDEPDGRG